MDIVEQARKTTLALTVTSGRSGTKLLTVILSEALRLAAEHEPPPRANFVMRSFVAAPSAAEHWLRTEKLPAMLAAAKDGFYAETSHLFCKGLIEPILALGLRPKLIILTRAARDVASSLYRMNVIPARTEAGRLVLLGPEDPGVLPLVNWRQYSDYQLCYWYAREIERRQTLYSELASNIHLQYLRIAMLDLKHPETIETLARFFGVTIDDQAFVRQAAILAQNQNSRSALKNASASPDRRSGAARWR